MTTGIGACVNLSNCNYQSGYTCAGVGNITAQETAGAELGLLGGTSTSSLASNAEWPAACDLGIPSATSTRIVSLAESILLPALRPHMSRTVITPSTTLPCKFHLVCFWGNLKLIWST
jgi:hypothetical protein